jgi:uncharacterized protein (TIGR02246 family)
MRSYVTRGKVLLLAVTLAAGGGGLIAMQLTGFATGGEKGQTGPNPTNLANAADEKAILKVQAAYVKAFNARDAKALAAFWTPDGEFTDAEGDTYRGSAAIEKEFREFFAESKDLTLEIKTESLRFVAPGVAIENGSTRVMRGADVISNSAYNIVHARRDGQWQLASVREAPYASASNYEHLRDLEWLVGDWRAKDGGKALEMSCEWTAKKNFLLRKYTLKEADGETRTGVQVIGWDPVEGGIRAWVFDSDGGFGSELWDRDGKRWVLEANGVTREGVPFAATNIVTRLDADSFHWQSVERSMGQARLPDTALVKVTRIRTGK